MYSFFKRWYISVRLSFHTWIFSLLEHGVWCFHMVLSLHKRAVMATFLSSKGYHDIRSGMYSFILTVIQIECSHIAPCSHL
jgi:hypothetical protein